MKREELKGKQTPGTWMPPHLSMSENCQCGFVLNEYHMGSICTVNWSPDKNLENGDNPLKEQAQANGFLIAEAGTVANQTGMWPLDMVERIRELERALTDLLADIGSPDSGGWYNPSLHSDEVRRAKEILNKKRL